MKQGIHPKFGKCVVKCACGNTFETESVRETLNVDVCSACHPFYTGKQKALKTGGKIEKFKRRQAIAEQSAKA